ncbi:UNC93-like protein [Rhodotorula toruloides]|nr:UNC93-like protein [Rhodotorula toruloides]
MSNLDAARVAEELPPLPHRSRLQRLYASPVVQVFLISAICFCTPGIFNANSGVGGGGQVNPKTANDANVALYACFAVVGFASGSIINRIGARLAFSIGASGYALYMGSLLSYNINGNRGFVVAAGALLGVCAGLLWTAQGSLMLAYGTEQTKGRLIALFWIVFNLGGALGSAIEVGLTWKSTSNTVGNSVYIVFLVDPATMVRSDGTRVIPPVHPTWKKEVVGMWQLMRKEVILVFLLPLFFSSNFGYTWQQNSFNGALFTLRTRSLNSFLFWSCQMVGAGIFGILIDLKRFRRKSRAWVALAVLLAFHCAVWGSGYHYQKDYYRTPDGASVPRIDLRDAGYGGRAALYVFMGILDAITQNYAYWLMGAIFNQPASLARLVGVYKAIQSAGAAGAFAMDSAETAYMSELAATWAVCVAGLVFCIPVLIFRLKDHTDDELVVEVGSHDEISSTSEKKADEAEL